MDSPTLVAALRRVVPAERVVDDPVVVESYLQDHAEWAEYGPAAVVRPRATAEVRDVVRFAVVPRGAGTGCRAGRTPSTVTP